MAEQLFPGLLLSLYKSGTLTKQEIVLSIAESCIHQVSSVLLGRQGEAAARLKIASYLSRQICSLDKTLLFTWHVPLIQPL